MLRTHGAGELRKEHTGAEVELAGWVDRRRDHGGLVFIDLRDRTGIVQLVFNPEVSQECHQTASEMRSEFVVSVTGKVALRPAGTENSRLPTGYVEVIATSTRILSQAATPPFYINQEIEVEENLRLRYRYLDLRRPRMMNNLILRHRLVKFIRDFLDKRGFLEIETPILIKSTPEGARDYLVPSRVQPGKFYALPQSPQQLKQLLMVAGMEKYFQIARCFRDEDLRADRQPEFTQLDLEMSFIEEEDILRLMEELMTGLVETLKPDKQLIKPFPRLTYQQAMATYGSDKPDLRFGMELVDISDIAAQSEFEVFRGVLAAGGAIKGICVPEGAGYTRHQLEELRGLAIAQGAKGLVTVSLGSPGPDLGELTMEMVKSVAARFLSLEQVKEMARHLGAKPGDLLLLVAG
ncbi:MAG: aspartate--tRNA ligase, partial [Dehalococcoidales bacterium]